MKALYQSIRWERGDDGLTSEYIQIDEMQINICDTGKWIGNIVQIKILKRSKSKLEMK